MRFKVQSESGASCGLLATAVLLTAGLLAVLLASGLPHGARLAQTFCPVHVPAECANTTAAAQQPGQPAAGSQLAAAAAAAQPQPASGQQAAVPAGTGAVTGWRAGRPDPGWAPLLGERQISKGILTYGDTARTRRLAAKLLRGEPITAAVVGGSITWGHGATKHGETDWSAVVFAWLRAQFPANHTTVNRAVPGTPSTYMSLCVRWHVPEDADLVIVEYNINDGGADKNDPIRKAHERLLRKLLSMKNRPAVMEVTFYRRPDVWNRTPTGKEYYFQEPYPFRLGGDDELAALAAYYHLPLFSCRNLMWDLSAVPNPDPKHHWEQWTADQDHPNDLGHRYMADMVISFLTRVLDDMDRHPLEEEDERAAAAELVPPLFKDNWPARINTCLMAGQFKELMVGHQGFEWINEGTAEKPKEGWVATAPGSVLEFEVQTDITPGADPATNVAASLAYLTSWEHMGQAEVACASGCTCKNRRLEGHIKEQWSQTSMMLLELSRAEKCRLRVTVLNETSSGEHKVKVMGIIVSEATGWLLAVNSMAVDYSDQGAQFSGR